MRLVVAGLLLALLGCVKALPPKAPDWANNEQRILACLDLQDHAVDIYSDEYLRQQGTVLKPAEHKAFRDGWAEELARRGTFDRFEQSCFPSITRENYDCGMAAPTPGDLINCLHLTGAKVSSSK